MLRWRSKTRGHYADHRIRVSAQLNRVAHSMWIAAEVVLPEVVAYHGETRPALYIFPRRKDRKSTRLNSSHGYISYAVFCLKKKTHRRNSHISEGRTQCASPRDSLPGGGGHRSGPQSLRACTPGVRPARPTIESTRRCRWRT